jgi:hypothetical protein
MVAGFSLSNYLGNKIHFIVVEADDQCFVRIVDVFVKEINLCQVQRSAGSTRHTVSGHSSCRLANISRTRELRLLFVLCLFCEAVFPNVLTFRGSLQLQLLLTRKFDVV